MPHDRVLITGVCGFTGRQLVARLRRDRSATIVGLDMRPQPSVPLDGYFACDLTDRVAVERVVTDARPNLVFHLAGLLGSASAEEIRRVNVGGFVCLCDAIRRRRCSASSPVRIVTVGSAAEIGSAGTRILPVTERAPCVPENPYGASKLQVTRLALAEPPDSPLQFVVARPFNLVGPGLSPQLSLASFARQVAAVARGEADAVHTGPLDARRDFVDVRDAVEAYSALAEHGRPGQIYNVCAGRSYRIADLLDRMVALAGAPVRVVIDSSRRRPGDVPEIYGDHSKITREVAWRPTIAIDESLSDLWTSLKAA